MDNSYAIRRLGRDDIGLFRDLLATFGEVFGDRETYTAAQPSAAYIEKLFDGDFIALAAACEGRVVGGLAAYELRKFERERSELYIYDLAVVEAHRRKGIGTRLIERLRLIARERGAYVIFVQADLVDAPAIALYSKLGTREDVLHFDIDVM